MFLRFKSIVHSSSLCVMLVGLGLRLALVIKLINYQFNAYGVMNSYLRCLMLTNIHSHVLVFLIAIIKNVNIKLYICHSLTVNINEYFEHHNTYIHISIF